MSTHNFYLRGIPQQVMELLKSEAKDHHISVNMLILEMIEKSLGYSNPKSKPIYHDLDHLAGSWSLSEAASFKKSTEQFEQIDKDLWSRDSF